jgi:dipeptidyl aminopeptidase/acylaminoacyl peptidase
VHVCREEHTLNRFIALVFMILIAFAAGAQTTNKITDPQQIISRRKDDLQTLSVERLLHTRTIGDSDWSPDGRQIVFVANISGQDNLWLVPAAGGWPAQLTVSDQRQRGPAWSPSGKFIAFTSDQDGNEQWDVFIVSPATGEVTNLSDSPTTSEEDPAWSPDSRYLAWAAKAQNGSYEIEIFDMLLRRRRALTQNTPKGLSNHYPVWSKDGKWIAYTQLRADGKDSHIYTVEVATGKSAPASHDKRKSSALDWRPDGMRADPGSEGLLSPDGSSRLYYKESADTPGDLWVETAATKKSQPITHSLMAGLRSQEMVTPVLAEYPGGDGKSQLTAWLYAPYNQIKNGQAPAIIYLRGEAAISQRSSSFSLRDASELESAGHFDPGLQFLLNQGYFVIVPNVTSASRVDNVLATAGWISRSGYIDSKKLVLMGEGEGGSLTLRVLAEAPESWAAALVLRPSLRSSGAGSPGSLAGVRAPVLLQGGAHDPHCPAYELRQIADSKKNSGKVELKIYENEGHNLSRVENRIDAWKRIAAFLKFHVPAPGCGCSLE